MLGFTIEADTFISIHEGNLDTDIEAGVPIVAVRKLLEDARVLAVNSFEVGVLKLSDSYEGKKRIQLL